MTIGLAGNVIKFSPYDTLMRVHENDLWPHGIAGDSDGGDKNPLTDGYHPILANFLRTDRATFTLTGVTGVLTKYNSETGICGLNIARGTIVLVEVYNVLTYAAGDPSTFVTTLEARQAVYLDDSPDLGLGVTLSFSPLNHAGDENILVGWIFHEPVADIGVGGPTAADPFPITLGADSTNEHQVELK